MSEEPKREFFATRLRNNFLTGLIICAPVAITIWLTWSFVQWADSWVNPYIPWQYNPERFLPFAIPGPAREHGHRYSQPSRRLRPKCQPCSFTTTKFVAA